MGWLTQGVAPRRLGACPGLWDFAPLGLGTSNFIGFSAAHPAPAGGASWDTIRTGNAQELGWGREGGSRERGVYAASAFVDPAFSEFP